jgi:hypothetical protein
MLKCVLSAVIAAMLATGCTTTVVVPPAPGCSLPDVLVKPCLPPAEIPAGISYGDLLKSYQVERKNLALCSVLQRDLASRVAECDAELARYNQRIAAERAKARAVP